MPCACLAALVALVLIAGAGARAELSEQAGARGGRLRGRRPDRRDRAASWRRSFPKRSASSSMSRTSAAPAATPARARSRARRADGYTIHMVVSTGFMVNPSLYAKVPYDPIKDFAPVTLVAASPNVVVGAIRRCRRRRSRSWCSSSRTIPASIRSPARASARRRISSGELFRLAFKLDLVARAVHRRRAGDPVDARRPHADRLHGAAAGDRRREGRQAARARRRGAQSASPRCPMCRPSPSRAIKDQESDTLTGIVVPAGTPKEIVDLLQREIAKIVAQPDVKEKLADARLRAGRQHAGGVRRADQGRDREVGQGGARREAED